MGGELCFVGGPGFVLCRLEGCKTNEGGFGGNRSGILSAVLQGCSGARQDATSYLCVVFKQRIKQIKSFAPLFFCVWILDLRNHLRQQ